MKSPLHHLTNGIVATILGLAQGAIFPANDDDINLSRALSPPANVTNNITWVNDAHGDSRFCRWVDFRFDDDADCDLWVSDCQEILVNSVIHNEKSWFEVSREWSEGNSAFVRVVSMGSCLVQVALLNGTNAVMSVQDVSDKINETILQGSRDDSVSKLRPSYGKVWCPGPPPGQGMPRNIGVEWMIGCNSSAKASVASLPKALVL